MGAGAKKMKPVNKNVIFFLSWLLMIYTVLYVTFFIGVEIGGDKNVSELNRYKSMYFELAPYAEKLIQKVESQAIEQKLYRIRHDIYKRQIYNLKAEINGLRTIIYKDKKLKHLIKEKI